MQRESLFLESRRSARAPIALDLPQFCASNAPNGVQMVTLEFEVYIF